MILCRLVKLDYLCVRFVNILNSLLLTAIITFRWFEILNKFVNGMSFSGQTLWLLTNLTKLPKRFFFSSDFIPSSLHYFPFFSPPPFLFAAFTFYSFRSALIFHAFKHQPKRVGLISRFDDLSCLLPPSLYFSSCLLFSSFSPVTPQVMVYEFRSLYIEL